jgi:hypothetical protein
MKPLQLSLTSLSSNAWAKPAREVLRLTARARAAALPIVAKACLAAIGQPSPATGFMIALALELGARLIRHPLVRAIF